ncbi:hypothetical protein MPSEU_000840900 [Mayamaea pseudoterrestris]|nr:hypothetical protein MPSEU_000840900 [Mayamaea pseudoterrestris]
MSLLYSITASILGTLEVVDTIMIWSRGKSIGQYEFDPRRLASFDKSSPAIRANLQFLSDWIGFTKLLVAVGFFASAWNTEPRVRVFAASSYCACMSLAFVRLVPSMQLAAQHGEVPKDTPLLFGQVTKIVMGMLGVAALVEYRAMRKNA